MVCLLVAFSSAPGELTLCFRRAVSLVAFFYCIYGLFNLYFHFFRLNIAYNGEPKYSKNKSNGLSTLGVIDFCNILDDGRLYFENKHMDIFQPVSSTLNTEDLHLKVDCFSISLSFVISFKPPLVFSSDQYVIALRNVPKAELSSDRVISQSPMTNV